MRTVGISPIPSLDRHQINEFVRQLLPIELSPPGKNRQGDFQRLGSTLSGPTLSSKVNVRCGNRSRRPRATNPNLRSGHSCLSAFKIAGNKHRLKRQPTAHQTEVHHSCDARRYLIPERVATVNLLYPTERPTRAGDKHLLWSTRAVTLTLDCRSHRR